MDRLTALRDAEGGAGALRQDLTPAGESRFQHRRAFRLELNHDLTPLGILT